MDGTEEGWEREREGAVHVQSSLKECIYKAMSHQKQATELVLPE